MDQKGNHSKPVHRDRSRKRKFHGNKYAEESDTSFTSTSAKKLRANKDFEVTVTPTQVYCILEFASVFSAISSSVICKDCKSEVKFKQCGVQGLGFKISMECECEEITQINSCPVINNAYEINRRIVFVMRLLGHGLEGLKMFCGLMDIGQGLDRNTYYGIFHNMYIAASTSYRNALSLAVTEEKDLNKQAGEPEEEFIVSGNGMWKKREFTSFFIVSTLIAKHTGKVVDACVMVNCCQGCLFWKYNKNDDPQGYEEWFASHEEDCTLNVTERSGEMEINAIVAMFRRSIKKHSVKYLTYIVDGDSKTFKAILNAQPYRNNYVVVKKECAGHIEKKIGTRLRNAKKANKDIGGKGEGKLTDKVIGELTKYYGLAIRRHPDSVEDMQKEIWATFYHKISTDDKPLHQNCPASKYSWCKWRRAEFLGITDQLQHDKQPLSEQVQKVIKPIYEDLSTEELLTRCLEAKTQNNNESLNSLFCTLAPKHLHAGVKVVEIAQFLAVLIFNEGFESILKLMEVMGVNIGLNAQAYVHHRNDSSDDRIARRYSDLFKRIRNKEDKTPSAYFYGEAEGILYDPRIPDW